MALASSQYTVGISETIPINTCRKALSVALASSQYYEVLEKQKKVWDRINAKIINSYTFIIFIDFFYDDYPHLPDSPK